MKAPHRRWRVAKKRETTGKPELIAIMQELEAGLTKTEAARSYDRVTRAINGWLLSRTKRLHKDLHSRLRLTSCFSLNMGWLRGTHPDRFPDWPAMWVSLGRRARADLRGQRYAEYYAWKARREAAARADAALAVVRAPGTPSARAPEAGGAPAPGGNDERLDTQADVDAHQTSREREPPLPGPVP